MEYCVARADEAPADPGDGGQVPPRLRGGRPQPVAAEPRGGHARQLLGRAVLDGEPPHQLDRTGEPQPPPGALVPRLQHPRQRSPGQPLGVAVPVPRLRTGIPAPETLPARVAFREEAVLPPGTALRGEPVRGIRATLPVKPGLPAPHRPVPGFRTRAALPLPLPAESVRGIRSVLRYRAGP